MPTASPVRPASSGERTQNPLRPSRLDEVIGQPKAKALIKRAIDACFTLRQPLDHMLFVGASGSGKSTFSHVIANELGVDVYELEAPIAHDMLLELRTTMRPGDILKVEEIHQQAIMERRGRQGATQPEVLYGVMEDRTITTVTGVLPFPAITLIGTTTDEGMLPDAFVNRFPLRPILEPYTRSELAYIARLNAKALGAEITQAAADVFADACGGVPRRINNLVRNALVLAAGEGGIGTSVAFETLRMNGITTDGLTTDMQAMLKFLLTKAAQRSGDDVKYQASVNTIATAIGKSRDSKAVALRVEPLLIERGFVQVTHGGRRLTDAGIRRAQELLR